MTSFIAMAQALDPATKTRGGAYPGNRCVRIAPPLEHAPATERAVQCDAIYQFNIARHARLDTELRAAALLLRRHGYSVTKDTPETSI